MLFHKKDKYLSEVIKYIKFPFDRETIRDELDNHILDKIDYYLEQGHQQNEAEDMAVKDMGSAKVIGKELNKQHNPILGWLWKLTNVTVVILLVMVLISVGDLLFSTLFYSNSIKDIPSEDIVYTIELNNKVKIDDNEITFTNIIYEKNGDINIFYESKNTNLLYSGWNSTYIGEISDDLGNKYNSGTSFSSGGSIKKVCRRTYRNFSQEASTLIIDYNRFNRKYRVEIPLKTGESND